jgi:hypothetical protein
MKERPSLTLFAAATATATSPVFSPGRQGIVSSQFLKTNTGEGDLELQTCDVDEATFATDPAAANIWVPHPLAPSAKVASGKLTVPATDPWKEKVKLTGIAAKRCRWVFTKSSGTVAVSGWIAGL